MEELDHGVLPGERKGMKTGGADGKGEEEETIRMMMKWQIPDTVSWSSYGGDGGMEESPV